ncbi:MAG: VWA domain-containing protein, partial [Planctomycetaceae bacterium]|nr:VWA domain-containing protein [Planctomycetaceae bacterium]
MFTNTHVVRKQDLAASSRRGAMIMLVVLCLPIVLIFSAFAVNVAWMQLTRTELRTATDASARAASRMLSRTQDADAARAKAIQVAAQNTIAGTPLVLNNADVLFGNSVPDTNGQWLFTSTTDETGILNGVRVIGDRSAGSASGSIPLLFSGVFGTGTFEPKKTAVCSHMDRDIMLVLDRSGSMGTPTPGGNRWIDLKKAMKAFLDALETTPQDELVGVATYSTSSILDEQMTTDYNKLKTKVD